MIAPVIESSSDIPSQIEPKERKPGQFDGQRARELVAIAWERRRERKAQGLTPGFKRLPEPTETFESVQLGVTRARITAEYAALADEPDPDLRFKLGCLLKKLWEIYQLLAQVPGPGTRKPKPERSQRGSGSTFEPVEE